MSLERIRSTDARNCSEDPLKEVAALQFLKRYGPHENVIEVVEVCVNTKKAERVA